MVGGQAWITPAFVISDCLRSPLSHRTRQLDYHPQIESELNEFHQLQIERILEFKFGFLFWEQKPTEHQREGTVEFAAGGRAS